MARTESPALSRTQAGWLLAASASALAPLTLHVPAWLSAIAGLALLWRVWLAWSRNPLPPRWILLMTVFAGTAGILAHYRTLFGQNPGVALLILLIALKQLEARTARDGLALVLLAYFLALAQFFYSQAIPAALTTLACVVVTTATLGSLADDRQTPQQLLKLSARMLARSIPFLLVLFVLFPRIQGPLWGMPLNTHSIPTGLSDTMAPGAISQLSRSDAIAFRARFEGEIPPRRQLYWRGPVLTDFDGHTWRSMPPLSYTQMPYEPEGDGIDYEVTLEPHDKPWLFAIELPGHLPPGAVIGMDYQLLAKNRITRRHRYAMRSHPEMHAGQNENGWVLEHALALPAGSNPRTRKLAESWRANQADARAILQKATAFFLRQGLTYTLTPPLLGRHAADEFLFDTRMGFCEHFADAFVVAMRAAGVPARVVTGYQGGEINPVDGYLTVHQYDAHAWAEVWIEGEGWLRVDPTAESAPLRVDMDLAAAIPPGDLLPLLMRPELAWLREARFRWDAVANLWNQWVLGYTPQRQKEFLDQLGMRSPDWQTMTVTLSVLCGAVLLAMILWMLRNRRHPDPAARAWAKLCRRLARRNLERRPWEGPRDYAERVAGARPTLAGDIRAIAELYGRLRYGNGPPSMLDELRRRVASFDP